jgi:RND family efflux transporter MFP subunit
MLNLPKTILLSLTLVALFFWWTTTAQAEAVAYDGLIEPHVVVDIGAPAQGIVAQVTVDRSHTVTKGQTLVKLESSVEWAAVEKAKALAAFEGDIGLQRTQLDFVKRVHERIKKLGGVSVQDKDQASTEIALTQYRLKKALESRILAKLELKKARAVLARRSIQSPISGVVVDRYVSPGEYVDNQPLLRVAQIDPLRIEVIVPARMFNKISPGMTAAIVPELEHYGEQTATVILVDKVIDSASSTFGVRLELPNARQQIPSGLRCQVRFEIGETADEPRRQTTETLSMAAELK